MSPITFQHFGWLFYLIFPRYYVPVGLRADWKQDTAHWWTCNETMQKELWDWTREKLRKAHKAVSGSRPVEESLMLDTL